MMAKPADKNIQSGNSRVKVTIYGQVNKALRVTSTGGETSIQTVDNDGSSSRIGIRAVGKANPNVTIGGWHELEWQENRRSGTKQDNAGNVRVRSRHVDLWVDHKNLGQLWLGHGSIAGDAAGLFSVTGTGHVFGSGTVHAADGVGAAATVKAANADASAVETVEATGKPRGWKSFSFFGARENRIMYVTPNLMGARLRVSYGENKSYSIGLRYGGAPPGVKNFSAAFAAGYRYDPNEHDDEATAKTSWAVSGGVKHSSGFNVSGGYETQRSKGKGAKPYDWFAEGGWTGKLSDMGATSLGIGYGSNSDGAHGKAQQYWLAINQNIDAAAADVYAGVAFDSGTITHKVSAAEAATTYTDPVPETQTVDGAAGFRAAKSPCYSVAEGTGTITKAAEDTTCAVKRDGVVIFLVGVRVKF